jgi:hypothetical protein
MGGHCASPSPLRGTSRAAKRRLQRTPRTAVRRQSCAASHSPAGRTGAATGARAIARAPSARSVRARPRLPAHPSPPPSSQSALIFTAIVTFVEVAFVPPSGEIDELFIINRSVDLIFIVDVALQFVLMYPHQGASATDTVRWIHEPSRIAWHYMTTWFSVDVVSIGVSAFDFMSLRVLTGGSSGGSTNSLRAFRVIRVARLVKLVRLVRSSRIMKRCAARRRAPPRARLARPPPFLARHLR